MVAVARWTEADEKWLVTGYRELQVMLKYNKAKFWVNLTKHVNENVKPKKTKDQVQSKMEGMIRNYKHAHDWNLGSGNDPKTSSCYEVRAMNYLKQPINADMAETSLNF